MAKVYGENYAKEWVNEPAEQADKGTRNCNIKASYEKAVGLVNTSEFLICKIQHIVRFVELEILVGTRGAGDLEIIDKDGNATAVTSGMLIDGAIEGGYDLVLTADAATTGTLEVLAKFLMD